MFIWVACSSNRELRVGISSFGNLLKFRDLCRPTSKLFRLSILGENSDISLPFIWLNGETENKPWLFSLEVRLCCCCFFLKKKIGISREIC